MLILALGGGLAVSGLIRRGETADGLARRDPLAGGALCVALIALAGLPPTAAFAARAAQLSGLAEPLSAAWALLLANVLLTAVVFLRFAARVALGRGQAPRRPVPRMPEACRRRSCAPGCSWRWACGRRRWPGPRRAAATAAGIR